MASIPGKPSPTAIPYRYRPRALRNHDWHLPPPTAITARRRPASLELGGFCGLLLSCVLHYVRLSQFFTWLWYEHSPTIFYIIYRYLAPLLPSNLPPTRQRPTYWILG